MKAVDKKNLPDLMRSIMNAGKTLIAPVNEDRTSRYKAIKDPSEAALDLQVTRMSMKEFFFPPSECILCYERDESGMKIKDPEPISDERVIFGARPCDAAALSVMDKVFTWDYNDAFYLARREKTTVVTIGCDKLGPACHCLDVGLSPNAKEGSDILLIPLEGEKYEVNIITDKGKKIAELWGDKVRDIPDSERKVISPTKPSKQVPTDLEKKFESPAWIDATMKCLSCGVCAYLCPTCHCFDIVDENDGLEGGERKRNWDVCSFSMFTKHGGGHNPRPEQWMRYRQRVMHKFDYYPEKFNCIACVGCGRCILSCPVGMDIFDVLEKVSTSE
jgi:ferredoxin